MTDTIPNTKTNIFFLNRSELEDRHDVIYYKLKNSVLKKFKFPLEKIGNSFVVKDGDHDKLPDTAIACPDIGRRYLRAQDLKENKIICENPIYVTEEYFQSVKRCHIFSGDLLFSIMASIGATAIVPNDYPVCTANRAIGILRKKINGTLLPEYVQSLFNTNLGASLLEIEKRGGIQQRLNLSDMTALRIPSPPPEIQSAIIKIYQNGLYRKDQKESAAKAQLSSVDTYILSELGITLPEKIIGLSNRIFTSQFSEVAGVRFDPLYFKNKGTIESKIYPNTTLRSIAIISKGQSITKENITSGNYPVIAGGQTSPYSHSKYNFEGNVITVSASGAYSGFVWFHDYKIFASDCIVLQSKNEKEISTHFIYYVLKALQQEIYKLQQGAGQPHVYARDLEKIIIPTPSPTKQKEMLKHIFDIHMQIKKLQSDALEIIGTAKREVEEMILG
jgi:type I restriction enzyme, S subunit